MQEERSIHQPKVQRCREAKPHHSFRARLSHTHDTAQTLWLMVSRRSGAVGRSGVEKGGVVAIYLGRGLPGWAEPQEQPARGGRHVLIHRVNVN